MKKYRIENPYEQLKEVTRGKTIDNNSLRVFISNLDINKEDKENLLALTPSNYIGNSIEIIESYFSDSKD